MAEALVEPANASTRGQTGKFLAAYLPSLYALQAAYAYSYVHSAYLRTAIVIPTLFRLAIWTLPVVVYLAARRRDVLDELGLRRNAVRGVGWGFALGIALLGLTASLTYFTQHRLGFNFNVGANVWIGPIALVGLSEEVVFRGFLLSEFLNRWRFWIANFAQAALFLLIHIPGWILLHQFGFPRALGSIASVLAMGVVLGFVRRKADSLWSCMILHSFNNLAVLAMH